MSGVGCLEHAGALDLGDVSAAEANVGWCVETDTGVAVLVVVPLEEALAERAAILDRAEPSRELRSVLERLELSF